MHCSVCIAPTRWFSGSCVCSLCVCGLQKPAHTVVCVHMGRSQPHAKPCHPARRRSEGGGHDRGSRCIHVSPLPMTPSYPPTTTTTQRHTQRHTDTHSKCPCTFGQSPLTKTRTTGGFESICILPQTSACGQRRYANPHPVRRHRPVHTIKGSFHLFNTKKKRTRYKTIHHQGRTAELGVHRARIFTSGTHSLFCNGVR